MFTVKEIRDEIKSLLAKGYSKEEAGNILYIAYGFSDETMNKILSAIETPDTSFTKEELEEVVMEDFKYKPPFDFSSIRSNDQQQSYSSSYNSSTPPQNFHYNNIGESGCWQKIGHGILIALCIFLVRNCITTGNPFKVKVPYQKYSIPSFSMPNYYKNR